MSFQYFNQNNYENVPYPGPEHSQATVKSGGCGVTCAAMIIRNLTSHKVDPAVMAAYSVKKGARNSGGTDMNILAKAINADYGISFRITSDENMLMEHLASGLMAIANVGGNRPGYTGVFSDGGHFIVCAGLTTDHKVIILDPGYYVGKFNKIGRAGKVNVNGNCCICDVSVLAQDTSNRAPAYWLFSKEEDEMLQPVKIVLNGQPITNGYIAKVNGKDTSFAPVRALAEALGAKVTWDVAAATVVITK